MIHDPQVEVTCDGHCCGESVHVEPQFMYRSSSPASGFYDCSAEAIEALLPDPWCIVPTATAGNLCYCSAECAENPE